MTKNSGKMKDINKINKINNTKTDDNSFQRFSEKIHVSDGEELLLELKKICELDKEVAYKVVICYSILSGKDYKIMKDYGINYRMFTHINGYPGIIYDIEEWIFSKGQIYFPDNPLKINVNYFRYLKLPLHILSRQRDREGPIKLVGDHPFHLRRIDSALGAYIEHTGKKGADVSRYINSIYYRRRGIRNTREYYEVSLKTQVELLRGGTHTKAYKYKIVSENDKLRDEDLHDRVIKIYPSNGRLFYLKKVNLDALDLRGRPIIEKEYELLSDVVLITYDCEWNMGDSDEVNVDEPDLISYNICKGSTAFERNATEPNIGKSEVIFGKDCVLQFLKILVDYTYTTRKPIYAIAHNAQSVEHVFIINNITKWYADTPNYKIEFEHVEGPKAYSILWRNIHFRDSFLFIAAPLRKICEELKTKSQKRVLDLKKVDWLNPTEEALEYARADSSGLMEACLKFCVLVSEVFGHSFNLNIFRFRSISSFVKSNLITAETRFEWDSEDMMKIRQLIYHGGRCECFFIGNHKKYAETFGSKSLVCLKIDIVSSYPHSMTLNYLPGKVIKVHRDISKVGYGSPSLIIGKIKYKTPYKIPPLAYKIGGKLVFPNFMSGQYRVPIWEFEYEYMKDNCTITDYEIIEFESNFSLQKPIQDLFDQRVKAQKEGHSALAFIYKLIMNSGYGSLGMDFYRERAVLAKGTFYHRLIQQLTSYTEMEGPNGFTWVCYRKSTLVNSLLPVASYTTALSRLKLLIEANRIQEEEGENIVYCDTDSLAFTCPNSKISYYKQYYSGRSLGQWVYETHSDNWSIGGLKVYRIGDDIHYKGIKGNHKDFLDEEGNFKKEFTITVWNVGRDGTINIKKVNKKMSLQYTKGYLQPTGIVVPISI